MEDSIAPVVNVSASVGLTISVVRILLCRTVLADKLVFGVWVISSNLLFAVAVAVFVDVRLVFILIVDVDSVLLGRTVSGDIPLASDGAISPGLLTVADTDSITTTMTLYYL